jgi:hypothetical protein
MSAYEGSLKICNFIDFQWGNIPDSVSIKTTGSFVSNTTFSRNDFLRGDEKRKCLVIPYQKARKGPLNYTVTLSNKVGRTALTGTYEMMSSWTYKKNEYTPREPFVPERWNNITPENERVAKTVWCIENGYRDYDLKTNKCVF